MASARVIPGVWGVLVSNWPLRMMRRPWVFQSGGSFERVSVMVMGYRLMASFFASSFFGRGEAPSPHDLLCLCILFFWTGRSPVTTRSTLRARLYDGLCRRWQGRRFEGRRGFGDWRQLR